MTIVTIISQKISDNLLVCCILFVSAKILIFFDFGFTKDFVINSNAFFVNKNVYKKSSDAFFIPK